MSDAGQRGLLFVRRFAVRSKLDAAVGVGSELSVGYVHEVADGVGSGLEAAVSFGSERGAVVDVGSEVGGRVGVGTEVEAVVGVEEAHAQKGSRTLVACEAQASRLRPCRRSAEPFSIPVIDFGIRLHIV